MELANANETISWDMQLAAAKKERKSVRASIDAIRKEHERGGDALWEVAKQEEMTVAIQQVGTGGIMLGFL